MTLFPNNTARELWIDHWCHRCFQPDESQRRQGKDTQCPIQAKALRTDRKPVEWTRNARAQTMSQAYKCSEFRSKPVLSRKTHKHYEDVPMFDIDPEPIKYVPVSGWPDRAKKGNNDHA